MIFRDAKGRFAMRTFSLPRIKLSWRTSLERNAVNVVHGEYWSSLVIAKHNDLVWC